MWPGSQSSSGVQSLPVSSKESWGPVWFGLALGHIPVGAEHGWALHAILPAQGQGRPHRGAATGSCGLVLELLPCDSGQAPVAMLGCGPVQLQTGASWL